MININEKLNVEDAKNKLERNRITVGLATCGISAGAKPVMEALQNAELNINIESVGCIGMCYNEPLVTVVKDGKKTIYGKVTKDNVQKLIDAIKNNQECEELKVANELEDLDFYKKQNRLVMEDCGVVNPTDLCEYVARGGFSGLMNALSKTNDEVIEEVKNSGLRGRGGAGFNTGTKWGFIKDAEGEKYLICNGDEGDPGAFMNRTVMESNPFRLLEGMIIGGYASKTTQGIIYTRAEYPLAIEILQKSIDILKENNLLGENILGVDGFSFDIHIKKGAGAFVCGEETALIASIEGKRGHPRPRPPFPAQKGVYGKPSSVNNVGSWAHVATIMKISPQEYAKIGTEKTKGTKVICLTGKIKNSGIIEVPIGISIKEIVYDIGGGTSTGKPLKAVLSGGPAGGAIPGEGLDIPLDYETLQSIGAIMGSGGMVVVDEDACMVDVARYFMSFTQEESCGKCTPCREGTKRLLEMLIKLTRGVGDENSIENIKQLAEFVSDNSLCGLGQNAPNPILSTLRFFESEYQEHIKGHCPTKGCKELVKYFITPECVGCGNCKRRCPVDAISGEPKQRHVIDQDKCIKCGTCYEVCAFKSISKD